MQVNTGIVTEKEPKYEGGLLFVDPDVEVVSSSDVERVGVFLVSGRELRITINLSAENAMKIGRLLMREARKIWY